jgi:adenylylsulfate kinase
MSLDASRPAKRQGVTVWMTGLPSAGKTTIARHLEKHLQAAGTPVELLDGDEIRERLSKGLGFSRQDRDENIRRISYVARLLTKHGAVVLVSAISPFRSTRDEARAEIGRFVEVHVDCLLDECIRREVKGLYKKALSGQIPQFTGISDPYEAPLAPEIVVRTHQETLDESAAKILETLTLLGHLPFEVLQPAVAAQAASVTAQATLAAAAHAAPQIAPAVATVASVATVSGGAPAAAGVGGLAASE